MNRKQETMIYHIFICNKISETEFVVQLPSHVQLLRTRYSKLNSLPLKHFMLKIFKIGARNNNCSVMFHLSLSLPVKLVH